MKVEDLRRRMDSCYARFTRISVVYFAVFAVVAHLTFITDYQNRNDLQRLRLLEARVEMLKGQLKALLEIRTDQFGIMDEIVVHRDQYVPAMRKGISSATATTTDHALEEIIRNYADALQVLGRFFRESEDPSRWSVTELGDVEKAVFKCTRLQSPTEATHIDQIQRLTDLARRGATQLKLEDGRPGKNLLYADNVFMANATLLNQALGRYSTTSRTPIISDTALAIRGIAWNTNPDSVVGLEALLSDIRNREREIGVHARGESFAIPYLNVTMRRGTTFTVGLLAALLLITLAYRQLVQLSTVVAYIFKSAEYTQAELCAVAIESAFLAHLVPSDIAHAPSIQDKPSTLNPLFHKFSLTLSFATRGIATLSQWLALGLFGVIPIFFILIKVWLMRTFGEDAIDSPNWAVNGLLSLHICLTWVLVVSTIFTAKSIRSL